MSSGNLLVPKIKLLLGFIRSWRAGEFHCRVFTFMCQALGSLIDNSHHKQKKKLRWGPAKAFY